MKKVRLENQLANIASWTLVLRYVVYLHVSSAAEAPAVSLLPTFQFLSLKLDTVSQD